ncbi:MAG TPA: glycoside hydrolase family 18 protein [Bacilli bacterium]
MIQIEVVDAGESLWSIGSRYGVNPEVLARANGLAVTDRLVVGQALVIPLTNRRHTVQAGETLWRIARRYGVSVQDLAQANNLSNPESISPGLVLTIPERMKMTIESNGYLQPTNTERDRTMVNQVAANLTYFSMFHYVVLRSGDLVNLQDEIARTAVNQTNSVSMMVISNFEEGNFSPEVARAILTDSAVRERLITNVLTIMNNKGFRALNIDFENLNPADRELYNSFLREITARVRAAGYLISTALAPKISEAQVGAWYEAHDYATHGQIVDFVIIMTYEWGWSGGPPMAVAPIPQVRQVLDFAVSVIPNNKIMMGAPLYGYDWTLPYVRGGKFARSLSPQAAVVQARNVGANIQFDPVSLAPFYKYYDNEGKQHVVWFEDARSMQAKFDLIKEYRLRGISYWVLGNPFPQNWSLLYDNFIIRKLR